MLLRWVKSSTDSSYTWTQEGQDAIALQWVRHRKALQFVWLGQNKISTTALGDMYSEKTIAAIIGRQGPQGQKGNDGSIGPVGPAGKSGDAQIPEVLDGGNF